MKSQLKSGVILSYITIAVQMVVQLIYTPLMINLLGQSEYGLYTLVASVVSYLSLLSFGATGAYLRFYMRFRENGDNQKIGQLNGMFMTVFLIMSAVALVSGCILAQYTPQIFGDKLTSGEHEKAKILMHILVFNIALTFPSSVFDSIVSAHEQFVFQRVLNLLSVIFNPLICLPLLFMGYGSVSVVLITLFISVLKLTINALYCVKKLKVKFDFKKFDFSLLREVAVFSVFLFLNMLIDQINWSVDKYILGRVSGTNEVAVYGVSATMNAVFLQFSTAISSVFAPRVNKIVSENKHSMLDELTSLFTRVGRIQLMVLGLAASGFVIFGRYFITEIYVTQEYGNSYYAALFLILPSIIPLIQNVGIEIQRAVNKHKFRSLVYLAMAFINIIVSIPLGIRFGSVGTAFGTGLSLVVANGIIMNIYYSRVIGIDILSFWKSISGIMKGLVIPVLFGVIIMNYIVIDSVMKFCLWISAYIVIYAVSVIFLGANKEEKNMLLKIMKKRSNI